MRKSLQTSAAGHLQPLAALPQQTTSVGAGEAARISCNNTTIGHNKSGIDRLRVPLRASSGLFLLGLFLRTRN